MATKFRTASARKEAERKEQERIDALLKKQQEEEARALQE